MKVLITIFLLGLLALTACDATCDPSRTDWEAKEACWCIAHNMTRDTWNDAGTCWNETCSSYNEAGVGQNCTLASVRIPIRQKEEAPPPVFAQGSGGETLTDKSEGCRLVGVSQSIHIYHPLSVENGTVKIPLSWAFPRGEAIEPMSGDHLEVVCIQNGTVFV
jgi:hypothetical protein